MMGNKDVSPMQASPRCTATSKRSGEPCKNAAVRGWSVCRMHGARGGSKPGKEHPAYVHGLRSQEYLKLRAMAHKISSSL